MSDAPGQPIDFAAFAQGTIVGGVSMSDVRTLSSGVYVAFACQRGC